LKVDKKVKLDVLIPVKNEFEFLHELLQDLKNLVIPQNFSVRYIFSDNSSTDQSYNLLKNFDLNNKILFRQPQDIGGVGNFQFLMKHLDCDYFMFIDGHDRISSNYIEQFSLAHNKNFPEEFIYIGAIVPLIEESNQFVFSFEQSRYKFSDYKTMRKFQFVCFLYHNSIWHSIFPVRDLNLVQLIEMRIFSFDHLLTYAGLRKYNLKYLDHARYFRRYRRVVGNDFSHFINNRILIITERASGSNNSLVSDQKLGYNIGKLEKIDKNFLLSGLFNFLLTAKDRKKGVNYLIFRFFRFFLGRFFRLNPLS
jgi:hypothetical protein